MSEYDNTNRGSVWKNEKKEKATHADFTGSINVDGAEYWLNGWLREKGASPKAPSMKFTVRRKEAAALPAATASGHAQNLRADMDDEIPF